MKSFRFCLMPVLAAIWLLAALPGNLAELLDSALNLPVAAVLPADAADEGAPVEQIVSSFQSPSAAIRPAILPPLPCRPVLGAAESRFLSASPELAARLRLWQFSQRAAQPPRAPCCPA